jgi:hypothetical protein
MYNKINLVLEIGSRRCSLYTCALEALDVGVLES